MDRLIRCITKSGGLMASAVDTSETVMIAQQIHGLTATTAAVLGRTLTGTAFMGAMLKSEKASVTVKLLGDGPVGSVIAISDSKGNLRGYVDRPLVDLPLRSDGKLNVGAAVGKNGRFGVIRDLGSGEPYIGQVELVSGEIAEDFTNYYATSEQIPTACALGVLTDKASHNVLLAGGLLIQVLPGANNNEIDKLEENIANLESMTTMLAKGYSLEEIVKIALSGFDVEVLDESAIHYGCTCSKEKYGHALITLGKSDLEDLPYVDDQIETVCPYCKKKYYFSRKEIAALINAIEE